MKTYHSLRFTMSVKMNVKFTFKGIINSFFQFYPVIITVYTTFKNHISLDIDDRKNTPMVNRVSLVKVMFFDNLFVGKKP